MGACDGDDHGLRLRAAAVGIVYDKFQHAQKFYVSHADDILSLAMDAAGKFVATGEQGARPRVHVWSAMDCQSICVLPLVHTCVV